MFLTIPKTIPRVALVTGGAKRVGRALVLALAAEGFSVAIHYRESRPEAEALLAEIGGKGCTISGDLADDSAMETLIEKASRQLGHVGFLINNASVFARDEWHDVTRNSWDQHCQINMRAPFVLSQSFARALPPDAEGVIINMLDERVWNLTPHFVSYTVSKSGLWTLTQTLALALAPRIRVNAIGPGPVLPAAGQSDEAFQRMWDAQPLRLGASPEEIASIAVTLGAMPSVTGQMIAADGGQHLSWRN